MISNIINPELIEGKRLLTICPSRGRVEKLKKMVKSFQEKSSPQAGLIVCVDEDDPCLEQYKDFFADKVCYYLGPKKTTTDIYNYILKVLPDYEFYSLTNDDFVYLTVVWDVKLMGNIEQNGGWGIAYGDDRIMGDVLPTTPVISGNIVRALGYLQLPSLKHLYGDRVWRALGRAIGRLYYDGNVIIQHEHPLDKKTPEDEMFKYTNSQQMYQMDQQSFNRWMKTQVKSDISKILSAIFKEKGFDKKISLCMIIAQSEDLRNIKQCITSVKDWVDEICVYVNYKQFPNPIKIKTIGSVIKSFNIPCKVEVGKFNNFSSARNVTLKQASMDYLIWLDCDDVVPAPWTIKDIICRFPDIDVFMCHVVSHNNYKADEHITQSRLLRRQDFLEFRNNVHEDVAYSYKEHKSKVLKTDIIIEHFGNLSLENVKKKNLRNYKLTLQEINKPDAHSLTYFAVVNELMLMGTKQAAVEAIQWIDKFFDKFPDDGKDPLVPKMWILRGACALDCEQVDAARTNFAMAWHKWKHPEAAVMLGECHIRFMNWDKAIEILEEVKSVDTFEVCNVPIDMNTIEKVMLGKLGYAYHQKAKSIFALKKAAPSMYNEDAFKLAQECLDKAEKNYMEFLSIEPNDLQIGDSLAEIFRGRGKVNDANAITVSMINIFPNYVTGWVNLAQFEMVNKRYRTAEVFYEKALQLAKQSGQKDSMVKEAEHNLKMIKSSK